MCLRLTLSALIGPLSSAFAAVPTSEEDSAAALLLVDFKSNMNTFFWFVVFCLGVVSLGSEKATESRGPLVEEGLLVAELAAAAEAMS